MPQNIRRIILTKKAHLRQMALRRVLGYNKCAAARRDQAPVSKPDSLTQTNRNLSVKPSAENGGNRADPLAICHRYFSSARDFSFGIFPDSGRENSKIRRV